ncbi:MAG: PrsW family glutamic-type intramembrane protease [Planctomycetaceae bacterium]
MPISFQCPHCGKTLRIPDQHAGKKGKCPGCKQLLSIPTPAESFDNEISPPSRNVFQKSAPAENAEDEYGFLNQPGMSDLEGGEAVEVSPPASAELPPRVGGSRKKSRTFRTSVEEPKPDRTRYPEFRPVEAEPPGPQDHFFLFFALALIPLAISIFLPEQTLQDRVIQRIKDQGLNWEDLDEEQLAQMAIEEARNGGDIVKPHLPEETWIHWGYAAMATLVFLGLLVAICGRSASPGRMLWTGMLTGTIGIFMLLAFQWIALATQLVWLRGGGIIMLVFLVVKLIGYSYICAMQPDSGFLASVFGFTMGVGLCEELCKAIPVLWYINSPQSNWKGAMLIGMASGIGFGVSEGITYSSDFYNGTAGPMIYLVRFTSCVTLHAVWAGAVGLIMFSDQTYCTDIDWEAALMFVVKYLSIAMLLHGLYDTLLKKNMEVGALAIALISWGWLAMLFYKRRQLEMPAAG